MIPLPRRARDLVHTLRELVFPESLIDPADVAASARAEAEWAEIFEPLGPLIADAHMLEVGCFDGRLLKGRLAGAVATGAARSAVGIDRQGYWRGEGGAVAWNPAEAGDIDLHDRMDYLQALDLASFDLVVCRSFEAMFPLAEAEAGLKRLYDLTRPGGEVLLRVQCADLRHVSPDGPGYGFMTPTSWIMLMMRAGFEIGTVRRTWRDAGSAAAAQQVLPLTSDEERMTAELRCRLIRPWEGHELDRVWSS